MSKKNKKQPRYNFNWLNPDSPWFETLFPHIASDWHSGQISSSAAEKRAYDTIRSLIARLLRRRRSFDASQADDATQEFMLRFSELLGGGKYKEAKGSLASFACGVAPRVVCETLRRSSRKPAPMNAALYTDVPPPCLEHLLYRELVEIVCALMPHLTKSREQSLTTKFGGMPGVRPLDTTLSNHHVRCTRGVQQLRKWMRDLDLLD